MDSKESPHHDEGTATSSATTLAIPPSPPHIPHTPNTHPHPHPHPHHHHHHHLHLPPAPPGGAGAGASNDQPGEIENLTSGRSVDGEKTGDVERSTGAVVEGPPPPPDGGYGWVCVACCFMVNACTWGLNSAYGVYLAYYLSHNLHPGATPYHYAFIGGLSVATSMTVGPVVALLYRRGLTTRHIMLLGILLQLCSLLGASFAVHSLPGLFLTQGVLFGLGLGFLFTSSIGTISQWFSARRSVANGLAAAGSGVGGLAFSIGLNRAMEDLSVAWSFRITAVVTLVCNLLAAFLIRDRNAHVKPTQRSFDVGLVRRRPEFGLVLLWGAFSLLGYIVILFSLADYSRSIGLSAGQGAVVAAMLSVGMTFGRPCVGLLSDIYGRINVSGYMTLLTAITVFALWMPAGEAGYGLCIVFALLNGAVCGTFWTTISPVTTEIVGLKELPSALSVVWLSTVLPTTFSEAIALALRRPELVGAAGFKGAAYLYPQVWSGVMYLAASGVMWVLRARLVGAVIKKEEEMGMGMVEGKEVGGVQGQESGVMARWRKAGRWWRWAKV